MSCNILIWVESGDIWSSCFWIFMSFFRFRKFSIITYLNKFSSPPSFSIICLTSTNQICAILMLSHRFHELCLFFFTLFFLYSSLCIFKLSVFELTDSFSCLISSASDILHYIFLFNWSYLSAPGFLGFLKLFQSQLNLSDKYLNQFFIFYWRLLSFLKIATLNYLSERSYISINLELAPGILFCSLDKVIFPWTFLMLVGVWWCLLIDGLL